MFADITGALIVCCGYKIIGHQHSHKVKDRTVFRNSTEVFMELWKNPLILFFDFIDNIFALERKTACIADDQFRF